MPGDILLEDGNEIEWNKFWRLSKPITDAMPLYMVRGNHEGNDPIYSGIAYTELDYNSRKHQLVIVPLNAMGRYSLLLDDTRISPYFGTSIGLFFKTENNAWMNKRFNTHSYSYILNTDFNFPLGKRIVFSIDLRYVFMMEALDEEIDYSGISPTLGIRIPLKGKTRRTP